MWNTQFLLHCVSACPFRQTDTQTDIGCLGEGNFLCCILFIGRASTNLFMKQEMRCFLCITITLCWGGGPPLPWDGGTPPLGLPTVQTRTHNSLQRKLTIWNVLKLEPTLHWKRWNWCLYIFVKISQRIATIQNQPAQIHLCNAVEQVQRSKHYLTGEL